ncbi:hypothetical protein T492DRAFT_1114768, partial [Pavlovales sp. CCMP2436]
LALCGGRGEATRGRLQRACAPDDTLCRVERQATGGREQCVLLLCACLIHAQQPTGTWQRTWERHGEMAEDMRRTWGHGRDIEKRHVEMAEDMRKTWGHGRGHGKDMGTPQRTREDMDGGGGGLHELSLQAGGRAARQRVDGHRCANRAGRGDSLATKSFSGEPPDSDAPRTGASGQALAAVGEPQRSAGQASSCSAETPAAAANSAASTEERILSSTKPQPGGSRGGFERTVSRLV